jgi:hypothetical protein
MVDGAVGAVLAAGGIFTLTAFDAAALVEAALPAAADLADVTLALGILLI